MVSSIITSLVTVSIALLTFVGLYAPHYPTPEPTEIVGGNAVGGKTYRISGSGISSSQTTINLTSFQIAGGSQVLLMSDFGDLGCGTVEPGHETRQEFISFTGVTQNSDGTAQLTGVTRGLAPISPYTASTTIQYAHAGGSQLVISNSPPCFYEGYANLRASSTIQTIWDFSTLPESTSQPTTTNQFTNKVYVDALANQGAATSTEDNGGIIELGTLAEQADSNDGGANTPRVLQTKNSTSTCQVVNSYNLVASSTTGKLDLNCFDANNEFVFASTTSLGTTTLDKVNVIDGDITLNGTRLDFIGGNDYASSTFLTRDAAGNSTFAGLPISVVSTTTINNMAYATVTIAAPESVNYMDIQFQGISSSDSDNLGMYFLDANNERSRFHAYQSFQYTAGQGSVTPVASQAAANDLFVIGPATTTTHAFHANLINNSATIKQMTFQDTTGAALEIPWNTFGSGSFNVTTAQVRTIVFTPWPGGPGNPNGVINAGAVITIRYW